jgi:hypothetical protein
VGSSLLRRGLLVYKTRKLPTLSTHSMVGYGLLPLVIPHLLLHRLIPAQGGGVIAALSPSEFGFEFVADAVATRPWMVAGYLALSTAGVYHAALGSMKVGNWLKRLVGRESGHAAEANEAEKEGAKVEKAPRRRRFGLGGVIAAVVGVVGLGLYRLGLDDGGISPAMIRRFEAVYAEAPWASIGFK